MNITNKKYILGIDTTSKIAGVALSYDNKIIEECNLNTGLTHSVTLFNSILNILNKHKISIKDIDTICVANGPGSFTGIRIGIATALGLSKAYKTKISYISSLKCLAYNISINKGYIVSMIDAKADRIYIAIFDNNYNQILNDMVIDIPTLVKYFNHYFIKQNIKFVFVGDGAISYKSIFKSSLKINYKISSKYLQKASSCIFAKNILSDIPQINYILASKAERERNEKN